ncbi:hypothetical protein AUEXF2481DRAFT_32937 [Aureobasidium subglaciale EXF-2481]|uniref:C2H2-type domain-containing protein n=1 Tax=Aureobasidium subglaciale (strain EXF-2481) TaxID=1043005 RepID=A0A074Y178_AURSE|nr:uncharacterized protein AUEXF2481DRAFT_32937 [Aureobasidium subglaciale EXF-2481]KAI5200403.1 hypothetical protein E4T38_06538 [Aureobasidium subglaciale]KAI5218979.1 hypothetical protein E4T40_06657 [Aureobasidium subglaciale]KAI5222663.1 hypothetical protein E4T41_06478 [Aureobasidium subglaciale]KAI5260262.1 hypothetical protein E4T46_06190 [Aureobasidium subglaciale]KEQ91553.1 hypothetical protein AUEXF2481DRAFT_32937 [Aureobasidium subglaciale EXF-2481]
MDHVLIVIERLKAGEQALERRLEIAEATGRVLRRDSDAVLAQIERGQSVQDQTQQSDPGFTNTLCTDRDRNSLRSHSGVNTWDGKVHERHFVSGSHGVPRRFQQIDPDISSQTWTDNGNSSLRTYSRSIIGNSNNAKRQFRLQDQDVPQRLQHVDPSIHSTTQPFHDRIASRTNSRANTGESNNDEGRIIFEDQDVPWRFQHTSPGVLATFPSSRSRFPLRTNSDAVALADDHEESPLVPGSLSVPNRFELFDPLASDTFHSSQNGKRSRADSDAISGFDDHENALFISQNQDSPSCLQCSNPKVANTFYSAHIDVSSRTNSYADAEGNTDEETLFVSQSQDVPRRQQYSDPGALNTFLSAHNRIFHRPRSTTITGAYDKGETLFVSQSPQPVASASRMTLRSLHSLSVHNDDATYAKRRCVTFTQEEPIYISDDHDSPNEYNDYGDSNAVPPHCPENDANIGYNKSKYQSDGRLIKQPYVQPLTSSMPSTSTAIPSIRSTINHPSRTQDSTQTYSSNSGVGGPIRPMQQEEYDGLNARAAEVNSQTPCPYPDCGRLYSSYSSVVRHLRRGHPDWPVVREKMKSRYKEWSKLCEKIGSNG